jgi:hypothetical protein
MRATGAGSTLQGPSEALLPGQGPGEEGSHGVQASKRIELRKHKLIINKH